MVALFMDDLYHRQGTNRITAGDRGRTQTALDKALESRIKGSAAGAADLAAGRRNVLARRNHSPGALTPNARNSSLSIVVHRISTMAVSSSRTETVLRTSGME